MIRREQNGQPLLDVLERHQGTSRRKAKQLLDEHRVFVNGRRVWMARHAVRTGDRVEIQDSAPRPPASAPVRVLYEDEHYLVADKPTGLLSNGPDSLEEALRLRFPDQDLLAVHRLDRETSGCNLFARGAAARDAMLPLFKGHAVTKTYHALVKGRVPRELVEIRSPVDGQPAVTHLRILDANARASHLMLKIETGRTHQIRVHLQCARFPVLGDKVYLTRALPEDWMRQVPRQMLHAVRLAFRHPATGVMVRITAPLPADFRQCLRALKLT